MDAMIASLAAALTIGMLYVIVVLIVAHFTQEP